MKSFLIFTLSVFFVNGLYAQDTLYVSMPEAVKTAISNNYLLNPSNVGNLEHRTLLPPTELKVAYGELYSPETSWNFHISQEISPLFRSVASHNKAKIKQALHSSRLDLAGRQFVVDVKSAYMQCVYLNNKLRNIETRQMYASKFFETAATKQELGETLLLDEMRAEMRMSELETAYLKCLIDLEMAEISLQKLMLVEEHTIASSSTLELYMVEKVNASSGYSGELFTNISQNNFLCAGAELDEIKASRLPSVSAGVFLQEVGNSGMLTGVSATFKIPVFTGIKNYSEKLAIIETENLRNEYEQVKWQTELEIDNLILLLEKKFAEVKHYTDYALPLANSLLNMATISYQHEEIEFGEFFDMVTEAMNIKAAYLESINDYNQAALTLELYLK